MKSHSTNISETVPARTGCSLPVVLLKKIAFLSNVSHSPMNLRLQTWFDGENEPVNADFIWNDIIVQEMTLSIQN